MAKFPNTYIVYGIKIDINLLEEIDNNFEDLIELLKDFELYDYYFWEKVLEKLKECKEKKMNNREILSELGFSYDFMLNFNIGIENLYLIDTGDHNYQCENLILGSILCKNTNILEDFVDYESFSMEGFIKEYNKGKDDCECCS